MDLAVANRAAVHLAAGVGVSALGDDVVDLNRARFAAIVGAIARLIVRLFALMDADAGRTVGVVVVRDNGKHQQRQGGA